MKNLILGLLVLCLGFTACNQSATTDEKTPEEVTAEGNLPNANEIKDAVEAIPDDTINVAKMTFTEETFDYGTVDEGGVVEHSFKFKNTGVAPLTITKAKSTCGCTVPDYPKEPIAPGGEGEITVRFNTKGKSGRNRKPVNITANTWPTTTTVYIDGTVKKDPNAAAADNASQPANK